MLLSDLSTYFYFFNFECTDKNWKPGFRSFTYNWRVKSVCKNPFKYLNLAAGEQRCLPGSSVECLHLEDRSTTKTEKFSLLSCSAFVVCEGQ